MNKNEQASSRTRSEIIKVARDKFINNGFYETSLKEIVEDIGMTRGAFYHHFKNKEEIFYEIMSLSQKELGEYVQSRASEADNLWDQLIIGCVAFVEKAIEDDMMKILLVDGPSIISWHKWKELDRVNSESHLKDILDELKLKGEIKDLNTDLLTSFISGGLNELAMAMSYNKNYSKDEINNTVRALLDGIKIKR